MVDFQEFLIGLRGRLNGRRQAMVDKAFLKFDKMGDGYIYVNDLKVGYNSEFHPKVISGEMTKDQCFVEFIANFGTQKEVLARREWNDYYSAVSVMIDDDNHFVELMRTAWRLD